MQRPSSSALVCQRCGRRCAYLWRVGRSARCRGCARLAGVQAIYPTAAAMGFPGRPPLLVASRP